VPNRLTPSGTTRRWIGEPSTYPDWGEASVTQTGRRLGSCSLGGIIAGHSGADTGNMRALSIRQPYAELILRVAGAASTPAFAICVKFRRLLARVGMG
jgi:hypothetical protein